MIVLKNNKVMVVKLRDIIIYLIKMEERKVVQVQLELLLVIIFSINMYGIIKNNVMLTMKSQN